MNTSYDEKITRRIFFRMVPVQILLVMCGGINVIIDGAFASNFIGHDAMAVIGLYGPLAKVLDTVNTLIFCGSQIMCGKFLGANTLKRARSIFTIDMIFMTLIGLIASVMFLFAPSVTASFCTRQGNELIPGLVEYLKGLGFGVIPFLIGTQLTSFLQLEKQEKLGSIGIGAMFIANTIGDYVCIKVLDLGLFGLGLSTTISNWMSFLVPTVYFLSSKAVFSLDFSDLHIKDMFDISRNGAPAAITQLMLVFRGLILNNLILRIAGTDGLAAYSAVDSFGYIYWAVPAGMSSALISLASIYTGEKDRGAVEVLTKVYLKRALPYVLVTSFILSALAIPLTNIFYHDPSSSVYSMTMLGFLIFPLSSPFSMITVGIRDIWRCMEFQTGVSVVVVSDGIAAVSILSLILSGLFGMTGIWIAQVAGGMLTVFTMYVMAWIHGKKMPRTYGDFCCFRDDFGVDEGHRLTLSIHSMDEVINISGKIIDFCENNGIDHITSFRAGLCVEELAGNIVKHGFTDKKNSVVDISVLKTDDSLLLRFKDNCALFNPEEIDAIFVPEDPCKNIGIRLVRKTCKDMEYHSLLGLNVLSITM